uniref:Uncharacterized protein n=1 Tax=Tanacetum cinerariifolium TaxID=118510 RepID=A0A6L2MX60_TANCI|nr:hypothetical protein [Tanacetum cinerariifolium]
MTLKDFLHFPGNRSTSFSARSVDVPMSVGSIAGSVANILDEELEMAVAASWQITPLVPRVIVLSLDVDSKGKRVTFPNSVGSPSFKKRKHVVFDEGPSSLKCVPDIDPSDEACKTLFGSLACTKDPRDSDPFLLGIEKARSSRDALCNLFYPDVQRCLDGLTLTELTNFHDVAAVRFVMSKNLLTREAQALSVEDKAMLVGRSQSLKEVASSGIGVELVDIKDFDPNAE